MYIECGAMPKKLFLLLSRTHIGYEIKHREWTRLLRTHQISTDTSDSKLFPVLTEINIYFCRGENFQKFNLEFKSNLINRKDH